MSVQLTKVTSLPKTAEATGEFCSFRGQRFYRIDNYNQMSNFFMSVVSAYDHWLFISSNGGLTAGRRNAQHALFPYYTEDKISDMAHCTGPMTLIREQGELWQPFATGSLLNKPGHRTLYKSALGDQLYFSEQKNGLQFDYGWSFSDRYGLVRTVTLTNQSDQVRALSILDGLQNLLPANIDSDLQTNNSVLLDAYKSSDCHDQNVAAYYLSSRLTDLAEPSESLLANTVWHHVKGDAFKPTVTMDSSAPEHFVQEQALTTDARMRGQRGAYFLTADISVNPGESIEWMQVLEVDQNASDIALLKHLVHRQDIGQQIDADIQIGSETLRAHLAKVDGLQTGAEEATCVHHQANALFNMMRGGFFEDGYQIDKQDLMDFVITRQHALKDYSWWSTLPETLSLVELEPALAACDSVDLRRLVREYLPISFSRRHGDPSRPWNKFSINLKNEHGELIKDYQGNWRDIFQNWEPLAYSYPKFLPAMISAFLNATTADGYNPYRVTRQGIEWEEPEPGNAWANIGYWSDHQIIYLSKLLELQAQIDPDWFQAAMVEPRFSYANVPYRIKKFVDLERDPYDSIRFDEALNQEIEARVATMGSDGKLLLDSEGAVVHSNLIEKLLTLWLAKLSNFVPEGGLWMNTQRPEWNDANNALAGWGMSVVTVAYLHRHLLFMRDLLSTQKGAVSINVSVKDWLFSVHQQFRSMSGVTSQSRYNDLQALVISADRYREGLYQTGLADTAVEISVKELLGFLDDVIPVIGQTLDANQRPDALFHGYNVLHLGAGTAEIEHLPLMLEGQVAMLSANRLSPEQALSVLEALRKSDLYREDQHTYLLYPNRQLPAFTEKNHIPDTALQQMRDVKSRLLAEHVLYQSADGEYHFNVHYRNAKDLQADLNSLEFTEEQNRHIEQAYETTFNHRSFTGRSGSFFAYEGLGSTYWHMVSKLLLAAQENWWQARAQGASVADALAECYYDIRAGIGFNKTPAQYGAFPTDPYSHTPETGIARQPGMTGQVKEELITRLGELGLQWRQGALTVDPALLKPSEFNAGESEFTYLSVGSGWQTLALPAGTMAMTLAQVPFVYHQSKQSNAVTIEVLWSNGRHEVLEAPTLEGSVIQHLTERSGELARIDIFVPFDKA
ncbi:hypothetical protein [Reinekea blandensis]|uniref:Cellobiose phosphorylase n=1 Tax=Reinekea blandensis MED297 TaxID=314283 RepID=A4BA64_9GAMM|nr:hypothetical protein [Reinekea blandensis]EAR10820.1 hypothetical protein MED297_09931 [Reinekea sp. MED297] [Reinekea blandensis MED297]